MPVMVAMLRGVNVGGHNNISMEALRGICASLKLQDARTYVQSGNVVFRTDQRDAAAVAASLESAIEKKLGFRPAVVLRKTAELGAVVAANPFARRKDIQPGKLLVSFLAAKPTAAAWAEVRKIKADPEEVRIADRELYIYFPGGMGRSKFPWAKLDKILGMPATGRNWNTVLKLLGMAEEMEESS
jgi:uncharacterized protein (DUF1697 family)